MTHSELSVAFIGQQSWVLGHGGSAVIVDPMLATSFGTSQHVRFEVSPRREVLCDELPEFEAVILSNEHLDHFHLPSIARLRDTPVFVPQTMPDVAIDALREVGASVSRLKVGHYCEVGGFEVLAMRGIASVPVWESRVHSIYVRSSLEPDCGVLIQSDTLPAQSLRINDVKPLVYIATQNMQVRADGQPAAFANSRSTPRNSAPMNHAALDFLSGLAEEVQKYGTVNHILFSGGGYTVPGRRDEAFLWSDFDSLAKLGNSLMLRPKFHGLAPGEELVASGLGSETRRLEWVRPGIHHSGDSDTSSGKLGSGGGYVGERGPIVDLRTTASRWDSLESELHEMAPHLCQSELGRSLLSSLSHGRPLKSTCYPLVLEFEDHSEECSRYFGFSLQASDFERLSKNQAEISLRESTAGLRLFASDFLAIAAGEIQVWEVASTNAEQWYTGDRLASPVAFLYSYYCEAVRPDLAARVYRSVLSDIGVGEAL